MPSTAMRLFTHSFDIFSPFLAIYPHVSTAITKSAPQNIARLRQIREHYLITLNICSRICRRWCAHAAPKVERSVIAFPARACRAQPLRQPAAHRSRRCRACKAARARPHCASGAVPAACTCAKKQAGQPRSPARCCCPARFICYCQLQFFAISSSSIGTAFKSSPAICPRISW